MGGTPLRGRAALSRSGRVREAEGAADRRRRRRGGRRRRRRRRTSVSGIGCRLLGEAGWRLVQPDAGQIDHRVAHSPVWEAIWMLAS